MLRTSLRYFLSVAKRGSMRMAAEELNVAQSAISRRVLALEEELGAPLLIRTSRGVTLSEIGARLVASLAPIVEDNAALIEEIGQFAKLNRGHVRIAAIESMLPDLLPRILDRYLNDHPRITFHVTVTTTPTVVQMVRNGDADIGIAFSTSEPADLECVLRAREPLYAVMKPDHPLAEKQVVSVTDVVQWPVAVQAAGSNLRTIFDAECASASLMVRPALETSSLELLHRFALTGSGVALLLQHTVASSVGHGLVVARMFEEPALAGAIEVLVLRGRVLPHASQYFIRTMRNFLPGD